MADIDETEHPNTSLYIHADPITMYPDLLHELQNSQWFNADNVRWDEDAIEQFERKIHNRPWEIACRLNIPKQVVDLCISIKVDKTTGFESAEAIEVRVPNLENKLRLAIKTDSVESILPMKAHKKPLASLNRVKPSQFTFVKCPACQHVIRDLSEDEFAIAEPAPTKESSPIIQPSTSTRKENQLNPVKQLRFQSPPKHQQRYVHGKPKSRLTKGSRKSRTLCPRGSANSVILPQVGSPEFDGIWPLEQKEDHTPIEELVTEYGNDSDDLPVSQISISSD